MRLSEALKNTEDTIVSLGKGVRLSEAISEDRPEFEFRALTQEIKADLIDITPEQQQEFKTKKAVELVKTYPKDLYSGSSAQLDSFIQGVLPLRPKELQHIGAEEAHPIAKAVGEVTGLIATGAMTGGIAPVVTYSKQLSALPTVARFVAGRMAQGGVTFGLKELADNMAEILGGDKKSFGKVVGDTLTSTAFGGGLGAVGSISTPLARIPAEAAYGFMTAKIAGADNFEAGVNAGIFAIFGLFNTKNLSKQYKQAAYAGAKQSLIDRMVNKGVDIERAKLVADRYFDYALTRNGGYDKATIKDFDQFSKAMRKGWQIHIEPEIKPKAGAMVVTPTQAPKVPAKGITAPKTPITEGKWQYGAEPAAAIPGEPIAFFDVKGEDFDTTKAQIIYDEADNEPLGYKVVLQDGTVLQNPRSTQRGGSPYFETLEEAQKFTEQKLSPKEGGGIGEPQQIGEIITEQNLGVPPEEPPKFPGVSENFLKQPKPKTTILQYFTPAEYHLKQLGFDAEIGQPVREALQDFSIELMQKNENLINIQKEHYAQIPKNKKAQEASNLKLWDLMDKGISESDTSVEAQTARKMRVETEEMLTRINKLNQQIGKEEVKGVKNYILHMLKPELLNEIYAKGVIPPELAKVMEYIPSKNVFLRTAMQRKGVPEEWLVKNPYELMRAMYAIDLRYVYLQEALNKIEPYLKAVKDYHGEGEDYWKPETYKYLDDWIKQAIKMRPSNWDTLIDNMLEYTFAPLLRKAGIKVSHMPWRDTVNTLSAAAHTGALGMRLRPILRNLVQSTFDWVMYGTKPYLKGSNAFLTKAGHDILKQSKVWKTRVPFEAQDLSTLNKIFKAGSLGYRASDLHNIGKGLLTRYHYAIDDLKMTHEEALKWADDDLAATQWSYRREDLPRAYWTTTGRAFWTLGSWWMNFYNRFLPELSRRAFTGFDVNGRKVPTSERLGIMRLLILAGTLFAIKETSKEITGTVIDYTGQVTPTPLREAPIAQMMFSLRDMAQAITDKDDRKLQESLKTLSDTSKIFIPWYLAGKDLFDLINGKKDLMDVMFYTGKKSAKVR